MNERWIAPAFIVAIASAIGLMVVYGFTSHGNTQLEGLFFGLAFLGIGTAIVLWGKHYMPHGQVIQERHEMESTPAETEEFEQMVSENVGDITRRKFLSRLGLASVGALGLAALFPLRSLGPSPGDALFHTKWKSGKRLVDHEGEPVSANRLQVGSILTVFPEGERPDDNSATLLVRVPENEFKPMKGTEGWMVDGNVAYSKVCTHVGCPVSLYRETTRELLCPCHQSTFDVLDGARATFGPAARPLPQLPLELDSEGYLVAQSDYREPVGPGFWNRGRAPKEA